MQPTVIAIAGPNGAGKTTIADSFLNELLGVGEYVNADTIARGLSQFQPQSVAVQAGRQNLQRLDELAASRASFAFETTLAGVIYAARIKRWKADGYRFLLTFFWLPDVSIALERVAARVASGGHDIPEAVIRQRYTRGLTNFFKLYRPLADSWVVYDNSEGQPRIVANGTGESTLEIAEQSSWNTISSLRT
jgi:predicted ABC-type ATPase